MPKLIMKRNAADNTYLHRDFHVTAEQGLRYIGEKMGDAAVVECLTLYTKRYFRPLIEEIKAKGLCAMKKYLEDIYRAEEASDLLHIEEAQDRMTVSVSECPAVRFMKSIDYTPCRWYVETTRTIYQTIADEAGLSFDLVHYDPQTGKAEFTFSGGASK